MRHINLKRSMIAGLAIGISSIFMPLSVAPAQAKPTPTQSPSNPSDEEVGTMATGGDVIRHDGIQNLIVAKRYSFTSNGAGGNCSVWNKNGGSTYSYLARTNNCATASMNGRTYSWTLWNDTDVFTSYSEPYWVKIDGTWRKVAKNVYTRIHDYQNAHCYRESDGINCYVSIG